MTGHGPTDGDSPQRDESHGVVRTADRRSVLTATAGMVALTGCLGGGDGNETSESATGPGDSGGDQPSNTETDTAVEPEGTTADSSSPADCPMLTESYATYDTGETPLPVDFEYPAAMEGSWTYQNRNNWAASNTIVGRIERGSADDGDGDIRMPLAVKYRARSPSERDTWYDETSASTLTTTEFNGESVEFLLADPGGPYAGEHNGWEARAMLPYQPPNRSSAVYFQAVLSIETLLFRANASDVTEACGTNQQAALTRTAESLSLNDSTTFGEYVQY